MNGTSKDPFYDSAQFESEEHLEHEQNHHPPAITERKRLSTNSNGSELYEESSTLINPSSPPPQPPPQTILQDQQSKDEISKSAPASVHSERSASRSETLDNTDDEDHDNGYEHHTESTKVKVAILSKSSTVDIDTQTERIAVHDQSIQVGSTNNGLLAVTKPRKMSKTPLAKTLLDQTILSALPIISFCQPFSMTSRLNDIILAMPRHLMIIGNQNSVSVYPWQQSPESTSTILECYWCSFLYKLLIVTLEDDRLFINDFLSIVDSIKLRGAPLSIKHQNYQTKTLNSSYILPSTSRYRPTPAIWSRTRLTKSNSLGIYYCYISNLDQSCMLTRVDHNTREHRKAIDCSGGSLDQNVRVCAMGLSENRVAIALTNLVMTIYDAENLNGLKQLNLFRLNGFSIRGISSIVYLWKTWLIFDPVDNKVVGIGKQKREFIRMLAKQPINACSMDNGTFALWLGYPGVIFYYRLLD